MSLKERAIISVIGEEKFEELLITSAMFTTISCDLSVYGR